MPEHTRVSRWLPTMLGAAIAVFVAMAYEFEWIDPDCPVVDCPVLEAPPSSRESSRDPLFAGARPHRSTLADAADNLALEDRVAVLQAQAELLAERNVTGELSYYGNSQAELEAMARHCDVRTDYPTRLDPQAIEDLGLDESERQAYDQGIAAFAAQELELYRALLAEVAPDTPNLDTLTLAQVRKQLTRVMPRSQSAEDDALQRHVAEERAGLREPPADPGALSAWNRYNRLRFNAGDRFAEVLAEQLGGERVHELRSAFGGWPGAQTRQWGCPGEQQP